MSEFLRIAKRPGLLRILAAIFYDLWLVAALVLLGAIVDTFLRQALTGSTNAGNHLLLQVWALISPLLFFGWFWTHGGQTLGMRAWRIRLVDAQGQPVNGKQATLRYLAAALSWAAAGLGFLWVWLDPQGSSWHDRLSGTYLVMTEKRSQKPQCT